MLYVVMRKFCYVFCAERARHWDQCMGAGLAGLVWGHLCNLYEFRYVYVCIDKQ